MERWQRCSRIEKVGPTANNVTDWAGEGLDEAFDAAWRRCAPVVEGWVDVVNRQGPRSAARGLA